MDSHGSEFVWEARLRNCVVASFRGVKINNWNAKNKDTLLRMGKESAGGGWLVSGVFSWELWE